MSEKSINLSFPLDENGFFRRECPLCCKEFKVLLEKQELADIAQQGIDLFMLQPEEDSSSPEDNNVEAEFTCPYCGQKAKNDGWWTQEQLAYVGVIAKNIMAQMVNKHFIRPLKRDTRKMNTGMISMEFKGKEMDQREPWISPETNDMKLFDLPCCQRKLKIDNWQDRVYCFFCGFTHL
jgi:hypothetical protein